MHGFLPWNFYIPSWFFLGFGSSVYDFVWDLERVHLRSFWRCLFLGGVEHARLEHVEVFENFLGIHVLELLEVHGLLLSKIDLFQWTLGSRVEVWEIGVLFVIELYSSGHGGLLGVSFWGLTAIAWVDGVERVLDFEVGLNVWSEATFVAIGRPLSFVNAFIECVEIEPLLFLSSYRFRLHMSTDETVLFFLFKFADVLALLLMLVFVGAVEGSDVKSRALLLYHNIWYSHIAVSRFLPTVSRLKHRRPSFVIKHLSWRWVLL